MSFLNPNAVEARRKRLLIGGAAALVTAVVATGFVLDSYRSGYSNPEPVIIYVESWAGDRSREDALAARAQEQAKLAADLAASRAYIATLPPEQRKAAQEQYDRYLAAPAKDRVG